MITPITENAAICSLSRITDRPHSHTRGFSQLWAKNLGVPVNHNCEIVEIAYVDAGVNFSGSMNIMGGWNDKWEHRLEQLTKSKKIIHLDFPCPEYSRMLRCRKDVKCDSLLDRLDQLEQCSSTLYSTDLPFKHLTVGDSHAGSYAPFESIIVKENGKTLFGQVRDNFPYVRETIEKCGDLESITMVFGSVDLRHHLCRVDTDWRNLLLSWKKFGDSLNLSVEYALPFPVEFEGRKLPKTGWYKGQPFWGSYEERSSILSKMWEYGETIGMNLVRYPIEWLSMDPEVYAKERMEKPQSVHLSPMFYRRMEWGQLKN